MSSDQPNSSSLKQSVRRGDRYERERAARILAIQNLFEAEFKNVSVDRIMTSQLQNRKFMLQAPVKYDRRLYTHLLTTYENQKAHIQHLFETHIIDGWSEASMNRLLRSIIKIAFTELRYPLHAKHTAVLISEYLSITKGFLEESDVAYVNKVLDRVAKIQP